MSNCAKRLKQKSARRKSARRRKNDGTKKVRLAVSKDGGEEAVLTRDGDTEKVAFHPEKVGRLVLGRDGDIDLPAGVDLILATRPDG